MEIQEALRIMRALADGVNPANGEALMADAVYQCAPVVRGFHRVVGAKTASVPKKGAPRQCRQIVVSSRRSTTTRPARVSRRARATAIIST